MTGSSSSENYRLAMLMSSLPTTNLSRKSKGQSRFKLQMTWARCSTMSFPMQSMILIRPLISWEFHSLQLTLALIMTPPCDEVGVSYDTLKSAERRRNALYKLGTSVLFKSGNGRPERVVYEGASADGLHHFIRHKDGRQTLTTSPHLCLIITKLI